MLKENLCLEESKLFTPRPRYGRTVRALLLTLALCAAVISCAPVTGSTSKETGDARITKFMINDVPGVIDQDKKIIEVVLPYDTDVTKLHPTVEFVGASIAPNPAPEETLDFSKPVTYTVFPTDGSPVSYAVLVTLGIFDTNRITAFALDGVDAVSVNIAEEGADNGTVYVVVPSATTLGGLTATIEHIGVSISPDGSVPQDFSKPVTYTVNAGMDHERVYTVTVTDIPSTANDITSFMIGSVAGAITGTNITLTVPSTTSLAAVKPVMKVSLGATVSPDPNTARDFTNPVMYTVTSASGAVKTYTVTVTRTLLDNDVDFPADSVTFVVSNTTEWDTAVSAIKSGGNNQNYIINVIGDFNVAGGILSATFGNVTSVAIAIRGSQTISLSSIGYLLVINAGQSVVLRDINLKGKTDNAGSTIVVYGIVTMRGSAKITGNSGSGYGGGVYVNGSFTMRDNTVVSGNKTTDGGGVFINKGYIFTMRDNAVVSGNTADYGGGVTAYGSFRIAGGTVYGSNAASDLKNDGTNNAALHIDISSGGNAEYGTFNADGTWAKIGELSATNNTIKVVNGVKQ